LPMLCLGAIAFFQMRHRRLASSGSSPPPKRQWRATARCGQSREHVPQLPSSL